MSEELIVLRASLAPLILILLLILLDLIIKIIEIIVILLRQQLKHIIMICTIFCTQIPRVHWPNARHRRSIDYWRPKSEDIYRVDLSSERETFLAISSANLSHLRCPLRSKNYHQLS